MPDRNSTFNFQLSTFIKRSVLTMKKLILTLCLVALMLTSVFTFAACEFNLPLPDAVPGETQVSSSDSTAGTSSSKRPGIIIDDEYSAGSYQ